MTLVNPRRYGHPVTKPPRDRRIPDLMTLVDAAKRLSLTREGLHKAAKAGRILGAEIGRGVWVFRRSVIEAEAKDRKLPPYDSET